MPGFVVPGPNGAIGGNPTAVPGRTEFFYSYTWEVFDLFEEVSFRDSSIVLLKDATLPTFTAVTDSYVGSSLEYKWAKGVVWEDVKFVWYDSVGLIDHMQRWRSTVWTPEDGLQMANDYKKISLLNVHLPTWDDDKAVNWKLNNSWPKMIKHGELTYTQSNVKLVEVTVAYDWAEET